MDDDELVSWAAAQGLEQSGYSVAVAANAREALRHFSGAAVALLDDDLPDADGLALADTLRRRHPRCRTVLMTADLTPQLRRQARERGITGVLEKPFSLETLVAAIREALEGPPAPLGPQPEPRPEADSRGDDAAWLTPATHGH